MQRKYVADSHRALFNNDDASSNSMNKRLKEKYKASNNSKILFTFGKSSCKSSQNLRTSGISRNKLVDQSGDNSLKSDTSGGTKLQRQNIINLTSEDSESRGYEMSQDASAIQLSTFEDRRLTTDAS